MDRLVLPAALAQPAGAVAPSALLIIVAGALLLIALGLIRQMLLPVRELVRALAAAMLLALVVLLSLVLVVGSLMI